jgi:hypothetical protein
LSPELTLVTCREREGREQAREWGNDDDGHEVRIGILRGNELILGLRIARYEGKYVEEVRPMRDVDPDLRAKLEAENTQEESDRRWRWIHGDHGKKKENDAEEENSDIDVCSDSDDN